MPFGTNGPIQYNGAPFEHESKTLRQLRDRLMIRLGFAAQLATPPPGMTELLNDFLYDAQLQMFRRPGAPDRIKRWWPVPIIAGERHYGIPSFSTGFSTDFTYATGTGNDTASRTSGSFIADNFRPGQIVTIAGGANDGLAVTIAAVGETLLTFAENGVLTAETGELTAISTVNYQSLEYRQLEEVWIQNDTQWWELYEGIDPLNYNITTASRPQLYKMTDNIEVFPTPDKDYTLWCFGVFGLLPFAEDTDRTTISPDLVFLTALGMAKQHYGQQDAGLAFRQAEVLLRNIVAEKQRNRRFIPRKKIERVTKVRPKQV